MRPPTGFTGGWALQASRWCSADGRRPVDRNGNEGEGSRLEG